MKTFVIFGGGNIVDRSKIFAVQKRSTGVVAHIETRPPFKWRRFWAKRPTTVTRRDDGTLWEIVVSLSNQNQWRLNFSGKELRDAEFEKIMEQLVPDRVMTR